RRSSDLTPTASNRVMKRLLPLLAVAVLAGAGVWAYLYTQSIGNAPKYRLARVERGPLTAAVSATGNLNAVITVQVGSQVSGQIKELFVDFNSVVKKSQVVARIDPDIFEAKVNQAKADLASAKSAVLNQQAQVERSRADVENARAAHAEGKAQTAKAQVAVVDTRRDLDRKTELFARELIAKSDLDSSQAAYDSAVAQLDSARAHEQALASAIQSAIAQLRVSEAMLESSRSQVEQKDAALKQTQVDLDHTTIRAPVDGVVVSRQVDVGQTVAASLQAPVLFTIAQDLTKMQVETSVDEADIGRIKLDDQATFTVDAGPRRQPRGATARSQPVLEQMRDGLVRNLNLSGDQQKKLEPILQDSRKQLVALQSSGLAEPDRRARAQKIRDAARVRIREILTPEQQSRYHELSGGSDDGRPGGVPGRAWLLGPDGRPAPAQLTLGLSDGTFTEVVRGDLKEGQEVIVGSAGGAARGAPQPQSGPRLRL